MNWEIFDKLGKLIKELEYYERKLKRLDDMPLMERAIVTSNAEMFKKHIKEVNKIKEKISNLEKEIDKLIQLRDKEKEMGETGKMRETGEIGEIDLRTEEEKETDETDLSEFEFADDSFVSMANSLDKQGRHKEADVIDELIKERLTKLQKPERKLAKLIRLNKKR